MLIMFQHVPYTSHWKLCFDGSYTNSDINIEMKDVQVMGKQGSEVRFINILMVFIFKHFDVALIRLFPLAFC